jgi:putative glycosyltransferase
MLSGIGVDGWTSLIASVWFFGGLSTLILGVLGIYIANILSETKRRPYTTVRRVHRNERAGKAADISPMHDLRRGTGGQR